MIENLRQISQHTTLGIVTEGIPAVINSIVAAAHKVAIQTFVISFSLLYLHHNIFAIGFVAGFIFDGTVKELVKKVSAVYNAKRTLIENVMFFGGGTIFVMWTMPTSLVISTLYYSAKWGASLCSYYKTPPLVPTATNPPASLVPSLADQDENILT